MAELPAESRAPRAGAATGDGHVPRAEGGGRREPAPARAAQAGGGAGAGPGGQEGPGSGPGLAACPPPRFGDEVLAAHRSRVSGFDEPNWVFMDMCRAREVARGASWQVRYPSVHVDYFTFIEDLFASVALSRLAAELGCDRLKDRE